MYQLISSMKWIFTILVSLISFLTDAQNYSGQYPGAVHFFSVNGSNSLTHVYTDSLSVMGNELIVFPALGFLGVNDPVADSLCNMWGGCGLKKIEPTVLGNKINSSSNFVKYFNFYGDSLNVNFGINIGDTQIVYQSQSANLIIKYYCFERDSATIFNVSDSLILFQVITFDTLGNLITNSITGDTILYSKNVGLLNGFTFDYFPNTISNIELKGIRNPNYGFYGLTQVDIYNYQIGDLIETREGNNYNITYHFLEVLSRTDYPSYVVYSMKDIQMSGNSPFPPLIYSYDTVFINKTYYKSYIDYEGTSYVLNQSIMNNCKTGTRLNFQYWTSCGPNYCEAGDCYGYGDCFGSYYFSGYLFEGVGLFETGNQNGMGGYSFKGVNYINIGGLECGSSNVLSVSDNFMQTEFSIFPNPTSNYITFQTNQTIQNGKIQLTDLSGRVLQQFNFDQSLQIDLSHFSKGIYLIKLYSNNKLLSVQKLVKE